MDPAQGETQGKSITSKLKAKVRGVKSKVHLPGHKKRQGDGGQGYEPGDAGSDSSSDDSPRKPGPETGYNVGASTPYTTVKSTPMSGAHEEGSPRESHDHDYDSRPSHTTSGHNSPRSMTPTMDEKFQYYREGDNAAEGMAKMDQDRLSPNKPREGVLGHVKDAVGGAAAAVGSKVGYYTEVDGTPVETDPNAPSVVDKAKASLGMDKPRDPNAPTLMEKTKAALGLDKPSDPNAPSMVDKTKAALGMDKPKDPNAPTLMEKTKASVGLGPSSPNTETPSSQPGVIDRVSGAMSSLFTSSDKSSAGEDVQRTFPAHSDYVPPAATVPRQSYENRSGEERMTTMPTGAYNQTMNR